MKSFAPLTLAAALSLAVLAPQDVRAQTYPSKPLRLIVSGVLIVR